MTSARLRHGIRVQGTVQGVGFRPTVHRLATERGLTGLVRNDARGVWIEIEGAAEDVRSFPDELRHRAPPLARIEVLEVSPLAPVFDAGFQVEHSATSTEHSAAIPADAATCAACLRELWDPTDRRYRYPFLNCTDCGPRYTIARELPWDRPRTTMATFALCDACRREYEDPADRRFHAEPIACPECGPQLELWHHGAVQATRDRALRAAAALLHEGAIVAVKGLGGFFLAVDARNDAAVRQLRLRKRRPHKPFALMARDLDELSRHVDLDPASVELLSGAQRPILLLPARPDSQAAPLVAPGLRELGVMLPYTPLHHLLLAEGPPLQVMTSGNLVDEPLARTNEEALARLGSIADAFLLHDREIHTRADDPVLRPIRSRPMMIRLARGFVPRAHRLPVAAPKPVLAVGAEQKGSVCLVRAGTAWMSQHLGDLKHPLSRAFFAETIERFGRMLSIEPRVVAHDLHPDYQSTRWAEESGLRCIGVQHHHAHIASCLAEHGREGPVLGVAFDGTGCGPRGELWGGELLLADLGGFRRLGHLRPLPLPGGEVAIREVWRLAVAARWDAGLTDEAEPPRARAVRQLLPREGLSPRATGAGRWFDAVAALCGLIEEVSYEGQAAVMLEAACSEAPEDPWPTPVETSDDGVRVVDLRPAIRGVVSDRRAGVPVPRIAARFHETLARAIVRLCRLAREATSLHTVALSGGCFQNRRLTGRAADLLEAEGFEVLLHREIPPNDGGVALGQAAVAAYQLSTSRGGARVPGNPR